MSTARKRGANDLTGAGSESKKPKTNGSITSFFGAPKPKPSQPNLGTNQPSAPQASSFNKARWVAGLTEEQQDLLKLEIDTLDESWLAQLKEELLSREFLQLKRFLKKEIASGAKIFPPLEDVYSWSRYTPLHKVRVVILGQDPYHNHNQAHGLCFSVRPPMPAPPSLKNIYIALKNDYPSFEQPPNKGGLLTPWAERGVLMLNTCLTVRAHSANSHAGKGWEKFTHKVIDIVAKRRTHGVVFLAWGTPAGKRVAHINRGKHYVLESVHPSPLSAHRGFFSCGHFKKANEWLRERYGDDGVIDWNLATAPSKAVPARASVKAETATAAAETKVVATAESAATVNKFIEGNGDSSEEDIEALEALAEAECDLGE
ncbi:uracil DNA glycosylase [Onygenales sp. PD_12]|nr:uracil DNA glycosylase [Onygenales sp. PD_12]